MNKINFVNGYSISNLRKIAKFIFKEDFVKLQQEKDDIVVYVKAVSKKIITSEREYLAKDYFLEMTQTRGLLVFREVVLKS